ncbi:DUF4158 domain-containing protein [Microbispora sp. H10836]|uniref:DUF4158 domain-containing protein n=1 Tax=Microbispora sp. H10836 TaxID=2729106 RepID=UPI002015F4B4|nr:DUF4158 domain-containing protein [Microbispora sp. H10836]
MRDRQEASVGGEPPVQWKLLDGDWELVGNKTGATRLGFGLLLKFFEQEGRFPRHSGEVPKAAVDYVAGQVKVDPVLFAEYRWSGSTIEYHRKQVRDALGFRESTRADEDVLAEWLADKICPMVFTDEGLRAALLRRCRTLKIEPPGRVDRIVGAGRARFEREFCLRVLGARRVRRQAAISVVTEDARGSFTSSASRSMLQRR